MKQTKVTLFLKISLAITLLWLTSACEKESPVPTPEPTVRVLIASSGLGDLSYNDNILRGILEAQKEFHFRLEYISPSNNQEAEQILRSWQAEGDNPNTHFTILAASEYEEPARKIMPEAPVNNYLMFDTKADNLTIPVFHFTGYGVSFLAGVAAYQKVNADTAVYLGGQQHESFIKECFAGFRDGYKHAGGKGVIELYLSDTQKGFAMPKRAYIMADSLYRLYPFIYAMAGNSNNGIYEYLRENPIGYTAGVDTDQSAYSDRIIGSMIKEVGRCVKDYIGAWLRGEKLPMRKWYTLESEFMTFQIAEPYKQELEKIVEENLPNAINKEKEYERTISDNMPDAGGMLVP